jgi:hypothetical protein
MVPATELSMRTSIIIAVLVLQMLFPAKGQDILQVNLRWNSGSTINLKANESSNYSCTFISSSSEIQWLQKNGTRVKHFAITSVSGTWSDITTNGSVVFQVTEGSIPGVITIAKNGEGTSVTLDFTGHSGDAIKQQFWISSVETEN